MKLFYATPSPFARKVRVMARELGLQGRIEEIAVQTTPIAPAHEVTANNPLAKIPTLLTDEGLALYDSRVICEYLLSIASRSEPINPASTTGDRLSRDDARWRSLRRQALADGILDAGLAHRYEMVLRPKALHWDDWLDAQHAKITRGLSALAGDVADIGSPASLDAISVACALGWLEFRMPDIKWKTYHPTLAAFYDAMASLASMVDTHPAH